MVSRTASYPQTKDRGGKAVISSLYYVTQMRGSGESRDRERFYIAVAASLYAPAYQKGSLEDSRREKVYGIAGLPIG